MWIMTTGGFYSAVQKGSDASTLTVRTRDRAAAQLAVDAIETQFGETCAITVGEGTDYPYRFVVSRENFALWVADEIREYLNYSNFKSAVAVTHGKDGGYTQALSDTWMALLKATDEEGLEHGITAKVNPHYSKEWVDEGWRAYDEIGETGYEKFSA